MDIKSMHEIKEVLKEARHTAHYNMGSPQALDHLLMHVVYLIEAILDGLETNEANK